MTAPNSFIPFINKYLRGNIFNYVEYVEAENMKERVKLIRTALPYIKTEFNYNNWILGAILDIRRFLSQ